MHKIWTSTTLLILPLMLTLGGAVWAATELTTFGQVLSGPTERLIALKKIDDWSREAAASKSKERPVMLLGSSLIMSSSYLCDTKYSPEKISADRNQAEQEFLNYQYFKYLEHQLSAAEKKPVRVVNLANSASLISEDLLLVKESMSAAQKPALIIVGIAPRDFLDHYTAAYHRSRLAQILLSRQSSLAWNFQTSPQENLDRIFTKIWCFYSQRVEYKTALVKSACDFFNRSASLFDATKKQEQKAANITSAQGTTAKPHEKEQQVASTAQASPNLTTKEKAAPVDMRGIYRDEIGSEPLLKRYDCDYRGRYLPLDRDRLALEKQSLEELVQFCKKNETPLVLISMPLTQRNFNLLPPEFRKEYFDFINSLNLQAPYGRLINITESLDFVQDDFVDTVHLRSSGGKKVADLVAREVASNHLLAQ